MKNKRKEFLKLTGELRQRENSHVQEFNMSGYAAPKIEVVRVGVIGYPHILRNTQMIN